MLAELHNDRNHTWSPTIEKVEKEVNKVIGSGTTCSTRKVGVDDFIRIGVQVDKHP